MPALKRLAVLLLALPPTAGCALLDPQGAAEARVAAETEPQLIWHTELVGDVVEVELTDPGNHYQVQRVELVGPRGQTYLAEEVTREVVHADEDRPGGYGGGGVGVGVGGGFGGGNTAVGIGLSFPLGRLFASEPRSPAVTRTLARIPVPDPAALRANPEAWHVNVHMLDALGAERFAQIPVPTAG